MKLQNLIEETAKCLARVKLAGSPKLSRLDFGILKVAMMVAALDGEVQASEIETFGNLAKKCRGYTSKTAKEAQREAFRSAGYLMLLAKTVSERELLAAFVDEALLAMPSGFLNGSLEDVRRAFVMWTAMGMGDGDFSSVERNAILALKKTWSDMKTALMDVETTRWLALSPGFQAAYRTDLKKPRVIKLIADDFLERAEKALAQLCRPSTALKAEDEIYDLIRNG